MRNKDALFKNVLLNVLRGFPPLVFVLFSQSLFASQETPQSFTLDGKLYSDASTGTPLVGTGTLKIQIVDSLQTCVLYEEIQNCDTTSTDGGFNIQVGEKTTPVSKRSSGDSGHTLSDVFLNDGSLITGKLASDLSPCTGSGASGALRYARITVTPTSGSPRVLSPNLPLSSIPSALVAENAQALAGKTASQFVQTNTTAPAALSQSNLENIFSTTNYSKLTDLLAGNSSAYVKAMANNSIQIPSSGSTPSTPAAGQLWYESGTLKYWNGSSAEALGVSGSGITSLIIGSGLSPAGTINTGGQTISVDVGVNTGQIVAVQAGNKLPALDGSNLTGVVLNGGQNGAVTAGTNDASDLVLKTNNSPRLMISSAGGVGVGTSAPIADGALTVSGVGDVRMYWQDTNAPVDAKKFFIRSSNGTFGAYSDADAGGGTEIFNYTSSNNKIIFNTSELTNVGGIFKSYYRDLQLTIEDGGGNHNIILAPTGTGHIRMNGNVGIGTTSPTVALDLKNRKDALALPSGTTAERPASPVNGYTRYNTDMKGVEAYVNGAWQQIASGVSPTASEDGMSLRWNDTAKQFQWFTAGVSGSGIGTLNGLTNTSQNFAIGTGGPSPHIDSATSTHTLHIPMANTASVTAGLISKSEFDGFNAKLGTATAFVGDVSGTYNNTSVDKIKGKTVTAAPTLDGQVLRYNGTNLVPAFVSMFDLRSTVTGSAAFGGVGCLNNQTLTWTAATDNLACSNISLPAAQLTGVLPVANGGTGTNSLPTTFVLKGGQNGAVTLGSNDGNSLGLKTGGVERVTVLSGGNVGIGTTAADDLLHLYKPAANQLQFPLRLQNPDTTMSGSGTGLAFKVTSVAGDNAYKGAIVMERRSSSGRGSLHFLNSNADDSTNAGFSDARMTILQTGNVGVGTTTPEASLDVNGMIKAGGTYTNVLNFNQCVVGGIVDGIKIKTNIPFLSNEFPTILIEGYDYGSGNSLGIILNWYGYLAGSAFTAYSAASYGGSAPTISLSNESGKVVIYLDNDKSTFYCARFNVRVIDPTKPASYYNGWTWADEALTGTSTVVVPYRNRIGSLIADGNIGIGTPSTGARLEISQNGASPGVLVRDGTNPVVMVTDGTVTTKIQTITTSSVGYVGNQSAHDLRFITDNTPKMTIQNSTGNVGIGTTAPNDKLTIQGGGLSFSQLAADPSGTASYGSVYVKNDGKLYYRNGTGTITDLTTGGSGPSMLAVGVGTNGAPSMSFAGDTDTGWWHPATDTLAASTGGTERIRIGSSGSVGIGTAAPSAQLHVISSATGVEGLRIVGAVASPTANYLSIANSGGNLVFGLSGTGGRVTQGATVVEPKLSDSIANIFDVKDGSANVLMRVDSSGNVGIGTASASTRLDLATSGAATTETPLTLRNPSTAAYATTNMSYYAAGAWRGSTYFMRDNTGSGGSFGVSVADSSGVGRDRLSIDATGNVGIGTTSATAKLEVAGQIVSKETVVASGATADFANGNSIVLQSVGGTTITVSNMVAGGVYNVVVEDTTARTYTFSGCATTYFSPSNGATSNRSVYTIYRRGTSICYITWTTGFN